MTVSLREAARRALASMPGDAGGPGSVTRVVLDVTAEGRTEVVTVVLRDGGIAVSSTGGPGDDVHITAALELLAGGAPEMILEIDRTAAEDTRVSSVPGTIRTVDDALPETANRVALADALEDLLVAIVRVGVREARTSATVEEAIERIVSTAPKPLPLGISRWIGMLRTAMAAIDVDAVGRMLEGAAQVAEDLRNTNKDVPARKRIVAWLGATADAPFDVERVSDRALVEVGRELVQGLERAGIERRYLMCLATGEIFREERPRGGGGVSIGPCPRLVTVGLGEIEEGAAPRRIRLLQYAIGSTLSADEWTRFEGHAQRRFDALARGYRDAVRAFPGLAEPFVVVAPTTCTRNPDLVLVDGAEDALPLSRADDPSPAAALAEFVRDDDPTWVSGRLVDADGTLLLTPCAAGVRRAGEMRVMRLS